MPNHSEVELLYQQCAEAVRKLEAQSTLLHSWPDLEQAFLTAHQGLKAWYIALPVLSSLATGGEIQDGAPVAAAWLAVQHAFHLLNNIQDGKVSPSGEGVAFSVGLISSAYNFLSSSLHAGREVKAVEIFSKYGFSSALGQSLSTAQRKEFSHQTLEQSLDLYWQATQLKSGSIFQAGLAAGAAASPLSTEEEITALGDYGTALAVMLQILDDSRDVFSPETGECEVSLPVLLYSMTVSKTGRVILPQSHAQLIEAGLSEMISSLLSDWRSQALDCLAPIKESAAKSALVSIPDFILKMESQSENLS